MNTASIKTATVGTNMVVFVRLLGHNHTEEKTGAYAAQRADNMSAACKPLGGERKIKKGIQPWHTCSDTSAFQREKKNSPVVWETHHHLAASREMLRLQGMLVKAMMPNSPSAHSLKLDYATFVVFRLSKLNWSLLVMLNIAKFNIAIYLCTVSPQQGCWCRSSG